MLELALVSLVVVAAVLVGVRAVRWILRNVTSTFLKVVSVCATVALLVLGLWLAFIILYLATGGH